MHGPCRWSGPGKGKKIQDVPSSRAVRGFGCGGGSQPVEGCPGLKWRPQARMHKQFRGACHRHPLAEQNLRKQGAQTVELKPGRGPAMFSHARRIGSVQRIAQRTRGISVVLYLDLSFCDSRGASGFIELCHPWRGSMGASNRIISPAHMRAQLWMTATSI